MYAARSILGLGREDGGACEGSGAGCGGCAVKSGCWDLFFRFSSLILLFFAVCSAAASAKRSTFGLEGGFTREGSAVSCAAAPQVNGFSFSFSFLSFFFSCGARNCSRDIVEENF
jgi:hypothetical protein